MALHTQLLASFLEKKSDANFWISVSIFTALGFAFANTTLWFIHGAQEQSRLFNAMAVLGLAMVMLLRNGKVDIRETLTLNPSAKRALMTTFVLLAAQFFGSRLAPDRWHALFSLLTVPAYCCGLAAFFRFVFGEGTRRLTRTAFGTLCAFLFLSMFMQPLDWPLRGLAGAWSASALEWMGRTVELGLVGEANSPPKLILWVNEYPFHVASECNGFGVILTSLLIALLLALYQRLNAVDTLLNLLAGLALGFVFNILRIVVIVLLAPMLMEHYMLMHEIVGALSFWGCIILLWLALKVPTGEEEGAEKAAAAAEN